MQIRISHRAATLHVEFIELHAPDFAYLRVIGVLAEAGYLPSHASASPENARQVHSFMRRGGDVESMPTFDGIVGVTVATVPVPVAPA